MSLALFKQALEGTDEIEVTVTGRSSGRRITNPVWFVQEGDELYLLPVRGSDTDWYRNVLKTTTIWLSADGSEFSATAIPLNDPARVRDVVDKFRAKHGGGEIARYYTKLDVALEVPLS